MFKTKGLLVLLSLNCLIACGQSSTKIETELLPKDNTIGKEEIHAVVKIKHVFNGNENIGVLQSANGMMYKRHYNDEGILMEEYSVISILGTDTVIEFTGADHSIQQITIFQQLKLLKNGLYRSWNDDGIVVVIGSYINGVKNGIWRYFDVNGILIEEKAYYFGELQ